MAAANALVTIRKLPEGSRGIPVNTVIGAFLFGGAGRCDSEVHSATRTSLKRHKSLDG